MISFASRRTWFAIAASLLMAASANALDKPRGKVVLSITGNVSIKNAGDRADFDMAMLAALPQHSFSTRTPWYKEARKFTGPLLKDVLAAAGVKGTTLKAVALNNFKVDFPVEDASAFPVVLARLMDDQPMSIRDKGPLFIIYPFDSNIDLQSARYYGRSAWQLRSLDVQ